MKIFCGILLLLSVGVCTIFIKTYSTEYFSPLEFDIRVINGFTNNSSLPLVIWCSSNDHDADFGGRALQEGDDFSWKHKTEIFTWGATHHVSCTMKWDGKRRKFDAFKAPRDIHRCRLFRKCSWLVREDGFYFSNDEVNWKKDFSWL
ncbi:hypothetical protein Tsubulata_026192 [Turnera subulata]|uniref:S-protein homolog n=1 Tax=Turnera subulata TaxID=218843 RepID=A0A9Q0FM26_9ROSI|nr:hypothetical protein Tsubulata_026192 [Turnera subulata]